MLRDMENWKPQDRPIQFTRKHNPYASIKGAVPQSELDEDAEAPFFTEAFLYNLLGKEDARSLLNRFEKVTDELDAVLASLPPVEETPTWRYQNCYYHESGYFPADCGTCHLQSTSAHPVAPPAPPTPTGRCAERDYVGNLCMLFAGHTGAHLVRGQLKGIIHEWPAPDAPRETE